MLLCEQRPTIADDKCMIFSLHIMFSLCRDDTNVVFFGLNPSMEKVSLSLFGLTGLYKETLWHTYSDICDNTNPKKL